MTTRKEIDVNDLENIVGGALKFSGGSIYAVENPSAVYHYGDIVAVYNYITSNWPGGEYNSQTLAMLLEAGLIW